jgi:predicted N-acyltransferase
MKQYALTEINRNLGHDVRFVTAEDRVAALKMHSNLKGNKEFVGKEFAGIEEAVLAANAIDPDVGYIVIEIGLKFFQVRVVSEALGLHCRARMVAADEDSAKKLAKDEFKQVVESFMSRGQTEPYVVPDNIHQRFLCEVLQPQEQVTLAFEWDKIGHKLSGER